MYRKIFKRLLDLFISLPGFIIVSPFLLISIIILLLANNGSPFFLQERPGKNEKVFMLIKLKTMNDKRDINGNLLPDDKRITKLGNFIRKTSFDEIPQLINVIKGDMSLIGPRPLLIEYLSIYSENQKRRHEVKPGITGWAQVNGRNAISWNEKFEHDIWYVENMSFRIDMRIFFLTIVKVFKSEGISSSNSKTAEKFTGNN
jgi:undecaprenyl phosphate N,N'-diacetylbacillosamine 1-phosphate transferase